MSNEDGSHPFNVEVLDKVKTILNNNRDELNLSNLSEAEADELAQKVAEIIYTYESDSDNSNSTLASPVTPHENTNDAVKDTRSNILQRIMERYRRAERYSDLKKLLELLEKRGFFNPEIKYDKQRYNPSPEKAGLIAGLSSSFDLRENSK